MKVENLLSTTYNKQRRKYDSSKGPQGKKAKKRLNRRFMTNRVYQKLVSDISEFRFGNKGMDERVYLAPIMDLCTGEILSYGISNHPTTELTITALKEALDKRPNLPYRTTVHTDQGTQYQTNAWRRVLKRHRVFQSMSRRATCLDNAAMESFFHIMKAETVHYQDYKTKEQLIYAMQDWINYYNTKRIKGKLKGKTPIEYRNLALEKVA